jgi:hypothetical protein
MLAALIPLQLRGCGRSVVEQKKNRKKSAKASSAPEIIPRVVPVIQKHSVGILVPRETRGKNTNPIAVQPHLLVLLVSVFCCFVGHRKKEQR